MKKFEIALVGEKLKNIYNRKEIKEADILFFKDLEDFFGYSNNKDIQLDRIVFFFSPETPGELANSIDRINNYFRYFFIITPSVYVSDGDIEDRVLKELAQNFDYVIPYHVLNPDEIIRVANFVFFKKTAELERKKYELINHAVVLDLYKELKKGKEDIPVFYYGVDHNGILKTIDDKILKILGFSKDEIIGKHFSELIVSEELGKIGKAFRERRTGDRGSKGIVIKFKKKDGGYKEFIIDSQGVHIPTVWEYPQKEPHRVYVGTFGRVKQVKGAREREEIDLFNTTNEPVFIYAERKKQLLINRGAERFFGYTSDEVLDKDPSFFEKDEYTFFKRAVEKLKEHNNHFTYYTVVKKKSGEEIDCEVSLDRVEFEGESYIIGIYRDISDYIEFIDKADSLIQLTWIMVNAKSKEDLMVNAARHVINILEVPYLGISLWNSKKESFDKSYISGRERGKFLSSQEGELYKEFTEYMKDAIRENQIKYAQINREIGPLFDTNGKRVKVGSFIAVPLVVNDVSLGCMSIFTSDDNNFTLKNVRMMELSGNVLSAGIYRYNLEAKLKKHLENLEKMVKERTSELEEFVYTISHDLKGPLYAAKSFSEIIKEQFQGCIKNEEDRYILRRINENIDFAIRMIDDLLTLSRVGTRELKIEEVDIADIIKDYMIQFNAIKKFDVDLEILLEENESPIFGDMGRLAQLFTNLFNNSVKYSKDGKVIIKVNVINKGKFTRITVEDNGVGIDESELDNIFKVFYRGESARMKNIEGSGCGLSIVKKIVDLHRGKISVQSKVGKGTTFIIDLPVQNDLEG